MRSRAEHYQQIFQDLSDVFVPGEGDDPIAFIVGEAPGAQETLARRPFVGPSGRALRDLMAVAGLFATMHEGAEAAQRYVELGEGSGRNIDGPAPNCWLTNAIKFRPPRNRTPTPEEIEYARDIVWREWTAVGRPDVVIAVGAVANELITGKRQSILKVSGTPRTVRDRKSKKELTLWPMVHPSFGIRNPPMRKILEKDWEKLGVWLDGVAAA